MMAGEKKEKKENKEKKEKKEKKSDRQDREKVLVCMRFFHCLFLYC